MAQWVKALVLKLANLRLISKTHVVEGMNQLLQDVL